ncbi:DUF4377 domain-containing protein [Aquimarina sp. U1-2]|uniref:DUF4377 domain-containing protein n=1 Tax=Aquimarina sp. U1-2 TaxID=2823141 RepID=UPI001AECBD11|nr:DUF4377 domain-containing protein [Aquimarina sp. U1-2]MBP2831136.1 DUF4377 domain-containing protein [Aquimarina sp. U1-2]
MIKIFITNISLIVSLVLVCSSCQTQPITSVYIADHTVDCEGVASQKCMLIKDDMSQDWRYFYGTIKGFNYEEGFTYALKIIADTLKSPLADDLSIHYSLLKIVSKKKSENTNIGQHMVSQYQNAQENVSGIIYEASTRGVFLYIKVDQNTIQKTTDRSLTNTVKKKCSQEDWSAVVSLLKNVPLRKINTLTTTTQKSSGDAAMQANLKIITNGQVYTSSSFDHGYPPSEIKALVNTILSLSESIE